MQELIFPLTTASIAVGLIIAGINIAKGSKTYAHKEDVIGGFKRVDGELKDVRKELAEKVSYSELEKIDRKIDGITDFVRGINERQIRFEALIEEWRRHV